MQPITEGKAAKLQQAAWYHTYSIVKKRGCNTWTDCSCTSAYVEPESVDVAADPGSSSDESKGA